MAYAVINSQAITDILNKVTPLRLSIGHHSAAYEMRNPLRIKLAKYLCAWKHYFRMSAKADKDEVYIERDALEFDKIRIYADLPVLERLLLVSK